MVKIESIDLWTEQHKNHHDCFNGAFIDGVEREEFPYDSFKIVRNCNCLISNNNNISIGNKHHAIIFYKNSLPIRLMVICRETNIDDLLKTALKQKVGDFLLSQLLTEKQIKSCEINLNEKPLFNEFNSTNEIDVGSCDRFILMKNMLKGSYTEDDTGLGHYDSNKYTYIQNLFVKYSLKTDDEIFEIEHEGGFLNELKTRIIILQKHFKSC